MGQFFTPRSGVLRWPASAEGPSAFARRLAAAQAVHSHAEAAVRGPFGHNLALFVGLALMPVVIAGGFLAEWAK